jgi:hypothetical protein
MTQINMVVDTVHKSLCALSKFYVTYIIMLKNILIRRRESDTYLAIVSRHHWSLFIS